MRILNALLITVSLGATACFIGGNAAHYPVANRVNGATVRIASSSASFQAELLEVRNNGIVVLQNDGRVAIAPWNSTKRVDVVGLGRQYSYGMLMPPTRETFANLVKVSHFPQGMTPEIEKRFLTSRGQTELVVIQ